MDPRKRRCRLWKSSSFSVHLKLWSVVKISPFCLLSEKPTPLYSDSAWLSALRWYSPVHAIFQTRPLAPWSSAKRLPVAEPSPSNARTSKSKSESNRSNLKDNMRRLNVATESVQRERAAILVQILIPTASSKLWDCWNGLLQTYC